MFLLVTVFFAVVSLAVFVYQKFANQLYYGAKIGGPKCYPLVGNAFRFINKSPPGKQKFRTRGFVIGWCVIELLSRIMCIMEG